MNTNETLHRVSVRNIHLFCFSVSAFVYAATALNIKFSVASEPNEAQKTRSELLLQLPPKSEQAPIVGVVKSIGRNGSMIISAPIQVRTPRSISPRELVTGGYYLGLVGNNLPSLLDARLLRVHVTNVTEGDLVAVQVAHGLNNKIKPGEPIMLVRPPKATAAQMKSIPDLVKIEARAATGEQQLAKADIAQQTRSANNLKRIGKALKEFHDAYNHYPPASLLGPDGKMWHSWRVYLLPYLDQGEFYWYKYRVEEPWDGPNNIKLLDSMPAIYSDQPPGQITDHFTRYAVVTGQGTAFSAEGFRFDGKEPIFPPKSGTTQKQWTDGASQTLSVGTLSSESKIPWTKPEDIVIGKGDVFIGRRGGFGAPYQSEKGRFALFTRLDGAVTGILDTVDSDTFRSMLTISGKEPLDWQRISAVFVPQANDDLTAGAVIRIFQENGRTIAVVIAK